MNAASATRVPSVKPEPIRARDIMSRRVVTLTEGQSLVSAMMTLVTNGISGAPVIDVEGSLVGVLSEVDCMKLLATDGSVEDAAPESLTVAQGMTRSAHTLSAETDLFSIASLFIARKVRRFPVVEDGEVVGIVSRRDVLQAISKLYR